MSKAMFIWLGSGRSRKYPVSDKIRLLDQATRANLPVPPGAILLDEFYRFCLDNKLIETIDNRIVVPDPELLHNTLFYSVRLPRFLQPVAVRCAFSSNGQAPAKYHPPCLDVDLNDPLETARALSITWTASKSTANLRVDVLIMDMIAAAHSGTAIMGQSKEEDQVSLSSETTPVLALPQLNNWRSTGESLPPYARRLQMLLRGVRRTFGKGSRQVDWVDNNRICFLMQVIPLPPVEKTLDPPA